MPRSDSGCTARRADRVERAAWAPGGVGCGTVAGRAGSRRRGAGPINGCAEEAALLEPLDRLRAHPLPARAVACPARGPGERAVRREVVAP